VKLKLDIGADEVAMVAAKVAAGERAVTAAMREAGTGLKSTWRLQIIGAGLAVKGSLPKPHVSALPALAETTREASRLIDLKNDATTIPERTLLA
jgi:hypothetical protein